MFIKMEDRSYAGMNAGILSFAGVVHINKAEVCSLHNCVCTLRRIMIIRTYVRQGIQP
jgi:hypothetical protein